MTIIVSRIKTEKTQLWFITPNVYICLTCYAFQQEEKQQSHIIGVENEKRGSEKYS